MPATWPARSETATRRRWHLAWASLHEYRTAADHQGRAWDRFAELHHRREAGGVDNHRGVALRRTGDPAGEQDCHERAGVVLREAWDRRGEAMALDNLALVLTARRRYAAAVRAHHRAYRPFVAEGDDW